MLSADFEDRDPCEVNLFKEDAEIPKLENKSSQGDLLIEFFEFYSSFDFDKKVICLFDATTEDKANFKVNNEKVSAFKVCLLITQSVHDKRHLAAIFHLHKI